MRKAKNLLGLKVISQHEGKDLGKVHDLLFSNDSRQLLGLLISDRGLFGISDATALAFSEVQEIGTHAVMVPSDDVVMKVHSNDRLAEAYDSGYTLTSKQLTTDKGETLGSISDLYLDDSGKVQGYEISGGLFSDAYNGRRYLDAPARITVGEKVIIMPHQIVDDINRQQEEQPGGIKGALGSAGETLTDTYDSAKDKAAGTYESIAGASVDKQREYVIGKTAGTDVIIPADKATMATPEALTTGAVEGGMNPNAPSAAELTSGGIDIAPVRANAEAIVPAANAGDAIVPSNQTPQPGGLDVTQLQKATPASATDVSSSGEVVDGEVLVRKGETITAEHADRAISAGILAKLVASAGAGHASSAAAHSGATGKAQGALSSAQQSTEDAVIGKPAAFEIDAPDGSILVAPGQIVTREILARADKHGKKAQVISSAGAGAVSESAQTVYAEAKDVATDVWHTLKEKTEELVGAGKEKKAEMDQAAQEKKIKDAVGRPTTRVILAQDDTIILNTGDIITNQAVQEARNADSLDMLLDSVYDSDPEITPEMMRAQGEGDATLATQAQPTGGPITATIAKDDDDS